MKIPRGLEPYRRTDVFTEATLPAALRRDHATREGTWAQIHVLEGSLTHRITDPRRAAAETVLTPERPPGVIEPTILHAVEPLGPVRFFVEFYRRERA